MKRSVTCAAFLLFSLALPLLLASCGALEGLMSKLGFDMHDYRGEAVTATHAPDSDIAVSLGKTVGGLTVNTPHLTAFEGAKEASQYYRDAILNQMLREGYARYAGNTALLAEAARLYPQLQIQVLIPADDFEATVYAAFGGSEKITNKDGALFRYLSKVDAYTTAAVPQVSQVVTTVLSCEETEKTYRLTFYNTLGDVSSPEYFALLIKRDDGTLYMQSLEEK